MMVWDQVGFSDPGTVMAGRLAAYHDLVLVVVVGVLILVGWFLVAFLFWPLMMGGSLNRSFKKNEMLETAWTVIPSFFLMVLGYVSLVNLYEMEVGDNVEFSVGVTGHQWYWEYSYILNWDPQLLSSVGYYDSFLKEFCDGLNFVEGEGYSLSEVFKGNSPGALEGESLKVEMMENGLNKGAYSSLMSEVENVWGRGLWELLLKGEFSVRYESYMVSEDELLDPKSEFYGGFRNQDVSDPCYLCLDLKNEVLVSTADVIHSWGVPELGVKVDAVPGRVSALSVEPCVSGFYYGFCYELCGAGHSEMPICVVVMSSENVAEALKSMVWSSNMVSKFLNMMEAPKIDFEPRNSNTEDFAKHCEAYTKDGDEVVNFCFSWLFCWPKIFGSHFWPDYYKVKEVVELGESFSADGGGQSAESGECDGAEGTSEVPGGCSGEGAFTGSNGAEGGNFNPSTRNFGTSESQSNENVDFFGDEKPGEPEDQGDKDAENPSDLSGDCSKEAASMGSNFNTPMRNSGPLESESNGGVNSPGGEESGEPKDQGGKEGESGEGSVGEEPDKKVENSTVESLDTLGDLKSSPKSWPLKTKPSAGLDSGAAPVPHDIGVVKPDSWPGAAAGGNLAQSAWGAVYSSKATSTDDLSSLSSGYQGDDSSSADTVTPKNLTPNKNDNLVFDLELENKNKGAGIELKCSISAVKPLISEDGTVDMTKLHKTVSCPKSLHSLGGTNSYADYVSLESGSVTSKLSAGVVPEFRSCPENMGFGPDAEVKETVKGLTLLGRTSSSELEDLIDEAKVKKTASWPDLLKAEASDEFISALENHRKGASGTSTGLTLANAEKSVPVEVHVVSVPCAEACKSSSLETEVPAVTSSVTVASKSSESGVQPLTVKSSSSVTCSGGNSGAAGAEAAAVSKSSTVSCEDKGSNVKSSSEGSHKEKGLSVSDCKGEDPPSDVLVVGKSYCQKAPSMTFHEVSLPSFMKLNATGVGLSGLEGKRSLGMDGLNLMGKTSDLMSNKHSLSIEGLNLMSTKLGDFNSLKNSSWKSFSEVAVGVSLKGSYSCPGNLNGGETESLCSGGFYLSSYSLDCPFVSNSVGSMSASGASASPKGCETVSPMKCLMKSNSWGGLNKPFVEGTSMKKSLSLDLIAASELPELFPEKEPLHYINIKSLNSESSSSVTCSGAFTWGATSSGSSSYKDALEKVCAVSSSNSGSSEYEDALEEACNHSSLKSGLSSYEDALESVCKDSV